MENSFALRSEVGEKLCQKRIQTKSTMEMDSVIVLGRGGTQTKH